MPDEGETPYKTKEKLIFIFKQGLFEFSLILMANCDIDGLVKISSTTSAESITWIDHQNCDLVKVEQIEVEEDTFEKQELSCDLKKLFLELKCSVLKPKETKSILNVSHKKNVLYECFATFNWLKECKFT